MTKEIDVRYMIDEKGNQFYPIVNIESVEGFDQDGNFEAIDSLQTDVSGIQQQIWNLQSAISNIPSVTDTGWQNLTLLNNTVQYSDVLVPKARLVTVNGVNFLSIKGSLKGLTSSNMELARIPYNMTYAITEYKSYAQNMSTSGGTAQFTRMRITTEGTIKIEGTTLSTVTERQWFPLDVTFML